VTQFDEQAELATRRELGATRVWLRADCDFLVERATFSYSTDGREFVGLGEPFTMAFQLATFQGVRYALFAFNTRGARGGVADFDSFAVAQPQPRGLTRPIPRGESIELRSAGRDYGLGRSGSSVTAGEPVAFTVVDRKLGRVALSNAGEYLSVAAGGAVRLKTGRADVAESFQWIETPSGELVLMSLATHRFLRIDPASRAIVADSPGPLPDGSDGVRFNWAVAK
jgi:xylan 1,4-beta-xylosidase